MFQYLIVLYGQVFPDDGYAQSRSDAGACYMSNLRYSKVNYKIVGLVCQLNIDHKM